MKSLTTRDSLLWTVTFVASVIVGLAAIGADLADLGVPEVWLTRLKLAALIAGVISGKLGNSPLNGKSRDVPKKPPTRRRG